MFSSILSGKCPGIAFILLIWDKGICSVGLHDIKIHLEQENFFSLFFICLDQWGAIVNIKFSDPAFRHLINKCFFQYMDCLVSIRGIFWYVDHSVFEYKFCGLFFFYFVDYH